MWVTLRRLLHHDPTIFLQLSTFIHQKKQRVSLRYNFNNDAFKNGEAAHLNNELLFFTG